MQSGTVLTGEMRLQPTSSNTLVKDLSSKSVSGGGQTLSEASGLDTGLYIKEDNTSGSLPHPKGWT